MSTNASLQQAIDEFVGLWGNVGMQWGISRSMAQIHGLLLVSASALTTDDIMQRLSISRGGVSSNVRDLIDWGLVKRVAIKGDRREYFVADKDIWSVFRKVASERKKREIDPLIETLTQISGQKLKGQSDDVAEFTTMVGELTTVISLGSRALEAASKAATPSLMNTVTALLGKKK